MPREGWKQTPEAIAARLATIKERYGENAHHEFGKKAEATNKKLYDDSFYREIGRLGGLKSRNGGYGHKGIGKDGLTGHERAVISGAKGGLASRRGKALAD